MEGKKARSHKFLCLRVGKPMKKTFISNASASMQQYAQQGKKHEYWFSVPQERSVPLLHIALYGERVISSRRCSGGTFPASLTEQATVVGLDG